MSQDRTIEQFLHDMRDTAVGVAHLVATTDRETFMTSPTGSWAIERGIMQFGEIAVEKAPTVGAAAAQLLRDHP